jgi:threonine/homoserine/homoserine lactone efflux protein
MSDLMSFLIAAAIILAAPGPTNTLMATSGTLSGIRRSLHLVLAAAGAYIIGIYAFRFAGAAIIAQYPVLGAILKLAVALYLVLLAVRLWRRPIAIGGTEPVAFRGVFVATLLNPKALIFAFTVFPQETDLLPSRTLAFLVLVAVACGGWIAAGAALQRLGGSHAAYIPRVAAVLLVGFAGFILRTAI